MKVRVRCRPPAFIGASGAFAGAWLSGRHARQLEHERWSRTRRDAAEDARAAAVTDLTRHLASALQTVTWFTSAAGIRSQLFTEQTIIDYDAEIRAHLTATIQGLVAVAHRDEAAFRTLEQVAKEVWDLDWHVAQDAAVFWSDPEDARTKIGARLSEAAALEQALPHRIVEVLQRRETGSVFSRVVADPA
jgi:hypothetical protein